MSAEVQPYYTPEEYLALERQAETKSEYLEGQIYAMSGASTNHNRVVGDLFASLHPQLRSGPCEIFMSDQRLKVDPTGLYTYPDIVVACGELQFDDRQRDTLTNPTVIVEVLSPSTELYDRGAKFDHYRRLPSLREYVLVTQDRVSIHQYTRQGEQWLFREYASLGEVLRLPSIDCQVPVREIYARVDVDPDQSLGHG